MRLRKIRELTPKALALIFISILLIVGIVFSVSHYYVKPFPPKSLVMATGMQGGAFTLFGERYRQIMARDKIHLETRLTSGSVENLRLLNDKSQKVDVGFVQGGIATSEEKLNLVSLGSLTYTPLWVFYRGDEILDDPSQLRGKRIAIGPEGSGAQKFALELLKIAKASDPPTVFYRISYPDANKAMLEGKIDAVMEYGAADNPIIMELLKAKNTKLMSFNQVEAYTRLFPNISHVILPKGILNPSQRFPATDVHLLSPTLNLIVREDLHPALVYLLLKAAVEIHGGAGWLHRAGEFPSLSNQDFKTSEQAQRFYKSGGGSLLYNYFPFWAATFIDRMLLILIPLGVVLIPLVGIAPWIYTWRNRSKYYRWYRELKNIEMELNEHMQPERAKDLKARLDQVDEAVSRIRVSIAFYDEVYALKQHIYSMRKKLLGLNRQAPEMSDD